MSSKLKQGRGRGVNGKGRSRRDEQFVPIPYSMATSPAWRSLSGPAIKVYVELRRRYNGANNGQLALGQNQAKSILNIGKSTAARAFDELAAKGFVIMTQRGAWYGRKATTWAVTDRPLNGYPATNDWKRWRPETDLRKTESRSRDGP